MTLDAAAARITPFPEVTRNSFQKEATSPVEFAERNYVAAMGRLYDFTPENQGNTNFEVVNDTNFQDRFEPLSRQLLADVVDARLKVCEAKERQIDPKDIYSDTAKELQTEKFRCRDALGVIQGYRNENADPLISLMVTLSSEASAFASDRRQVEASTAPSFLDLRKDSRIQRKQIHKDADMLRQIRLYRIGQVEKFAEKNIPKWLAERGLDHKD